jgi:trehalose 2-sulfotransferase
VISAAERRTRFLEFVDGEYVDIFEGVPPGPFEARFLESSPWTRSYVIAFEERSGSTMLCSLLAKTGMLGTPEEFLNPRGPMQMYLGRGRARDLESYWAYVRNALVTPNGVLGMKTTYPDFMPFVNAGGLERLLEPVQFIHLTRTDVLRQAVSSALARKRDLWHAYRWKPPVVADTPLEDGDETLVSRLMAQVLTEREAWTRFFELHEVPVLRITYEDLIADPPALLRRIFGYLDVDVADDAIPTVSDTDRLSNETNEAWVREMQRRLDLASPGLDGSGGPAG